MEQFSSIRNGNHSLKLKEDVKPEPRFLVHVEHDAEFSKSLESFDYLIRCQDNFKHAICMSAFRQPIK